MSTGAAGARSTAAITSKNSVSADRARSEQTRWGITLGISLADGNDVVGISAAKAAHFRVHLVAAAGAAQRIDVFEPKRRVALARGRRRCARWLAFENAYAYHLRFVVWFF